MTASTPKPEWDMLLSAAQKNLPDRIKTMVLKDGVDPSHSNAVGQSALHIAALWGNVEAVRVLVELGANVNAQNKLTGASPLHMVANSKKSDVEARIQVIDALLDGGASVDQADNFGAFPISMLESNVEDTNENIDEPMQRLIAKLQSKGPIIFDAISALNFPLFDRSLSEDPSIADLSYRSQTPLSATIREFLERIDSDDSILIRNDIPIIINMITALLKCNVNPNCDVVEKSGTSEELKEPVFHKLVVKLREILKTDSTNNVDAEFKLTSITDVINCLMSANVNVPDETKLLLHQAARFNELKFAAFLLNNLSIDPNMKGRQGMTPLQFAARSGKMEIMKLLLEQKGIDVDAKDDRGATALDSARVNGKDDAVCLLESFQ